MNDRQKNILIPKLRFPEFKESGEWEEKKLEGLITEIKEKTVINNQYTILSSSKSGIYIQNEYFKKQTASKNNVGYKIIKRGEFTYRSMSDNGNFTFNIQDKVDIGIVSPAYPVFKIKNKQINAKWLYYYLNNTNKIKIQLLKTKQGSTRYALKYKTFSEFKVDIPPQPAEQQKITSCLSSLDELLEAHKQKLELLKAHKKGLMQNLFPQEGEKVPKLRFPEFKDSGEWEEKKLGEVTIKIGDGIHTTPKYDENGKFYFINGNNLVDSKIYVDSKTKRVSQEEFEKHKMDLTEQTILLSINGTIGNVAYYKNEKVILGKSACYINPNEDLNTVFLFYILQSSKINNYFLSELTGSTIKNLSLKSIRETKINLPSKQEQQKIAECLSSVNELITAEAEKIEQLEKHKKGLMQGLFPEMNE